MSSARARFAGAAAAAGMAAVAWVAARTWEMRVAVAVSRAVALVLGARGGGVEPLLGVGELLVGRVVAAVVDLLRRRHRDLRRLLRRHDRLRPVVGARLDARGVRGHLVARDDLLHPLDAAVGRVVEVQPHARERVRAVAPAPETLASTRTRRASSRCWPPNMVPSGTRTAPLCERSTRTPSAPWIRPRAPGRPRRRRRWRRSS